MLFHFCRRKQGNILNYPFVRATTLPDPSITFPLLPPSFTGSTVIHKPTQRIFKPTGIIINEHRFWQESSTQVCCWQMYFASDFPFCAPIISGRSRYSQRWSIAPCWIANEYTKANLDLTNAANLRAMNLVWWEGQNLKLSERSIKSET